MARVALSFDDGPGPATQRLLDVLAARGVKATFFLLGKNLERARDVAVRMAREGHVLGNHSFAHPRADAIDAAGFAGELRRTDELLAAIVRDAGLPPRAFPVRLPYGPQANDPRLAALAALGRTHVHWTGDFHDWQDPDPATLAAQMRAHVAAQSAAGLDALLDLHDSSKLYADRSNTVEAVRLFLADATLELFTATGS
jgi:chitin deacetylase